VFIIKALNNTQGLKIGILLQDRSASLFLLRVVGVITDNVFEKVQVFIAGRKDERKLTHHIRRGKRR